MKIVKRVIHKCIVGAIFILFPVFLSNESFQPLSYYTRLYCIIVLRPNSAHAIVKLVFPEIKKTNKQTRKSSSQHNQNKDKKGMWISIFLYAICYTNFFGRFVFIFNANVFLHLKSIFSYCKN